MNAKRLSASCLNPLPFGKMNAQSCKIVTMLIWFVGLQVMGEGVPLGDHQYVIHQSMGSVTTTKTLNLPSFDARRGKLISAQFGSVLSSTFSSAVVEITVDIRGGTEPIWELTRSGFYIEVKDKINGFVTNRYYIWFYAPDLEDIDEHTVGVTFQGWAAYFVPGTELDPEPINLPIYTPVQNQSELATLTTDVSNTTPFTTTIDDIPSLLRQRINGILSVEANISFLGGAGYSYKPKNLVVFIPGIAGSALIGDGETGRHKDGSGNGCYLWPSLDAIDIRALNLHTGADDVKAVGVIRDYDPAYVGLGKEIVYGPFIDFMETESVGLQFFDLDEYPDRMTSDFPAATNGQPSMPTFFPFPYDWRKSNADHMATLRRYIQNIRQLHGGAKVNVVAHSMGGLLFRRYILEYGSDDVANVVTVGSPFWGAPVAIYRMLVGDLYDWTLIDWWNNDAIKATLPTFPSFHELLPSPLYLQNAGRAVFSENGWDFNHNRNSFEEYSAAAFWAMIDEQASLDTPSSNNMAFHGYRGGRQDDWSADTGGTKYLHIYGNRPAPYDTPVAVKVETVYNGGSINRGNFPFPKFTEIKGAGDKVVPYISGRRPGSYSAPNTMYREIVTSDLSEHTEMMRNRQVLDMIVDFLDDGQLSPTSSPAAASVASATAPRVGRRQISIRGPNYVRITDGYGNSNTKLNSSAAKRVPGIDIQYGGSQMWVDIECATDQVLCVESDQMIDEIEIVLTDCDTAGVVTYVSRYRYQAGTHPWKLSLASAQAPDLRVDQNDNASYEQAELVSPTQSASGANIDTTPPTISLDVSVVGGNISVAVMGSDGSQPAPAIFYSLGSGPIQTYAAPLLFSTSDTRQLKVFAEDAMGNTTGLIETAINPNPTVSSASGGTFDLRWPVSEAFILEESTDLVSWTTSSTPINKVGVYESASVSTAATTQKFYRLKSQRVLK